MYWFTGKSFSTKTFARYYPGRFDDDTGISLSKRRDTFTECPFAFDENFRLGHLSKLKRVRCKRGIANPHSAIPPTELVQFRRLPPV